MTDWRWAVKPGGVLSLTSATDPGFAQRAVRRLTTARTARKPGIDYQLMIAREHRNHEASLMVLLERVFTDDDVTFFGLPFPWKTWNFNISSSYLIIRS